MNAFALATFALAALALLALAAWGWVAGGRPRAARGHAGLFVGNGAWRRSLN